jgi:poly(A) polymerase
MQEDGVLAEILPEASGLDRLARLIPLEPGGAGGPDALRRLAALVAVDAQGALAVTERLRLSNAWRDRLVGLARPRPLDPAAEARAQRLALYRLGADNYRDLALLTAADGGMDRRRLGEFLALAESWAPPQFPLAGRDVTALGIPSGPRVGRLLAELRRWWEETDFTADRSACMEKLKGVAGPAQDQG